MKPTKQVREEREDIEIEQKIWDIFDQYPKLTVHRTIYILAGLIKYISAKQK